MGNISLKWSTKSAVTTLMTTELNSLAAAGLAIAASAYDNRTALDRWADFELQVTLAATVTDGRYVTLYLIPSIDDTNYSDGSGSIQAAEDLIVGGFRVRNVTTAQRIVFRKVQLPPGLFKAYIKNDTDKAFAASGNIVRMITYDEQVVSV